MTAMGVWDFWVAAMLWLVNNWAPLSILGAVYCAGGMHGLGLAWTQEARMRRWAAAVSVLYDRAVPVPDVSGDGLRDSGGGPPGVPGTPVPGSVPSGSGAGVSS